MNYTDKSDEEIMSIFRKKAKDSVPTPGERNKISPFDWISYILMRFFQSIDEFSGDITEDKYYSPNEREYVLESQPIFRSIINSAVMEDKITFIGMETGTVLECPDCNLPAEIRFQAVDEYENRMFLLSCINDHDLWVDLMYIEYALDKKARELL